MMEVMEDREVWRLNLELLPPATLTEKRALKKEEEEKEEVFYKNLSNVLCNLFNFRFLMLQVMMSHLNKRFYKFYKLQIA